MSWNEQDIDHLFKGAKAPEPPAFQEEFWKEMEAMLPEAPKRRIAGFWWITGIAATLILLVSGISWMNQSGSAAQLAAGKTEGKPAEVKQPSANGNTEQTPINASSSAQETITTSPENRKSNAVNGNEPIKKQKQELVETPEIVPETPIYIPPIQAPDLTHVPLVEEKEDKTLLSMTPRTLSFGKTTVARTMPDAKFKGERFYVQASAGIGQSAQQNVASSSDLLHYYAIGGGLYKRIDRMVLTFGVNGRVDFARNVISSEMIAASHRIDTRYSELYLIEMPVSLGFNFGRNTFSATLTPGFQAGFSGKESEFDNEVMVRSERASGKVQNSKTLTMEVGLSYWRTLKPNCYLGAAINADAIRPFNPNNFIGEQRMLPVNGQIILRRTF